MRLLHMTELRFEEFYDDQIPEYAILSHRWGSEEVSYQDFLAGRKKDGAGYAKILQSCKVAARGGYQMGYPEMVSKPAVWIWVDTCCIDKSSSAELSEAINSMYRWYYKSQFCYVFLKDVTISNDGEKTMSEFVQSEWFARGWTLQELLAPKEVIFLDENWAELGNKITLVGEIASTTGISKRHFDRYSYYAKHGTVAEKMMWARKRKTSRVEDQAYCLLGLFDINMPLLYGEGSNAFRRLQLEILKSSDDESIFAWNMVTDEGNTVYDSTGVLAKTPHRFLSSDQGDQKEFWPVSRVHRPPYSVTNKGLEFRVPAKLTKEQFILLPLNCCAHRKYCGMGFIYAIALHHRIDTGDWTRQSRNYMSVQDSHLISESGGLYVVSQSLLWNRQTLDTSGSEVIYLRLYE